jgi:hypothetical protein
MPGGLTGAERDGFVRLTKNLAEGRRLCPTV